jgi:hypothetical protein
VWKIPFWLSFFKTELALNTDVYNFPDGAIAVQDSKDEAKVASEVLVKTGEFI